MVIAGGGGGDDPHRGQGRQLGAPTGTSVPTSSPTTSSPVGQRVGALHRHLRVAGESRTGGVEVADLVDEDDAAHAPGVAAGCRRRATTARGQPGSRPGPPRRCGAPQRPRGVARRRRAASAIPGDDDSGSTAIRVHLRTPPNLHTHRQRDVRSARRHTPAATRRRHGRSVRLTASAESGGRSSFSPLEPSPTGSPPSRTRSVGAGATEDSRRHRVGARSAPGSRSRGSVRRESRPRRSRPSVSRSVWQPPIARDHEPVDPPLPAGEARPPGAHVLVEAQLAAGAEDPASLGERLALIGHRAEHPAHDHDVGRARGQLRATPATPDCTRTGTGASTAARSA